MTMKLAFALFLFGAVVVMGKPTQNDEDRCDVENLVDCGWLGINQGTCEARSCCWNSSVPSGLPWCHRAKDAPPPTCIVDPTKRKTNCGWLGINQHQCEARGCCWQANSPGDEPWCYLKDFDIPPYAMCPVGPSQRNDCGKVGTTKDQCLADSCCWDDTIQNTLTVFISQRYHLLVVVTSTMAFLENASTCVVPVKNGPMVCVAGCCTAAYDSTPGMKSFLLISSTSREYVFLCRKKVILKQDLSSELQVQTIICLLMIEY
ncbi:integumentary mucin C.1-like isoform X1 [Montipora foliosa]|uniref:integumentary mucin C.1-like isoform X1 n=1 Tax=Montipora foliosa TaxID=591990 RepID=UPI0035F17CAE